MPTKYKVLIGVIVFLTVILAGVAFYLNIQLNKTSEIDEPQVFVDKVSCPEPKYEFTDSTLGNFKCINNDKVVSRKIDCSEKQLTSCPDECGKNYWMLSSDEPWCGDEGYYLECLEGERKVAIVGGSSCCGGSCEVEYEEGTNVRDISNYESGTGTNFVDSNKPNDRQDASPTKEVTSPSPTIEINNEPETPKATRASCSIDSSQVCRQNNGSPAGSCKTNIGVSGTSCAIAGTNYCCTAHNTSGENLSQCNGGCFSTSNDQVTCDNNSIINNSGKPITILKFGGKVDRLICPLSNPLDTVVLKDGDKISVDGCQGLSAVGYCSVCNANECVQKFAKPKPTSILPVCGNSSCEEGESCDGDKICGDKKDLKVSCRKKGDEGECTYCGDGVIQNGEECDEGGKGKVCGSDCKIKPTPTATPKLTLTPTPTTTPTPVPSTALIVTPFELPNDQVVSLQTDNIVELPNDPVISLPNENRIEILTDEISLPEENVEVEVFHAIEPLPTPSPTPRSTPVLPETDLSANEIGIYMMSLLIIYLGLVAYKYNASYMLYDFIALNGGNKLIHNIKILKRKLVIKGYWTKTQRSFEKKVQKSK